MSDKKTKLSVILPTFNDIEYIEQCLNGITNQTYENFEVVVVDGGSSDGTKEYITQYGDDRIHLVSSGGLVESLQKGIKCTEGEFIARVDADTYSYPTRFEKQVSYLNKYDDVAVVGTAVRRIDPDSKECWDVFMPTSHDEIVRKLLDASPLVHPSVMIRRSMLEAVGGYRSYHWEDYELWTRLQQFRLANIDEILVDVYQRKDSIQGNTSKTRSAIENTRCGLLAIQRGSYNLWERSVLYVQQIIAGIRLLLYKLLRDGGR